MTENDREEEIRRRYRALAREEPPRALDDAILAAARRELETRPAPLVAPSGRRRWAVPIAAAAVIVLSAVVTLHVQREQPDAELAMQVPAPPAEQKDERAVAVPRAEAERDQLAAQPGKADRYSEKKEAAKLQAPERRRGVESLAAKPSAPRSAPPAPDLAGEVLPKPPADPGRFSPDPAPATAPPAQAPQMQMRPAAPLAKPAPRAAESASAAAGPPPVTEPQSTLGGLRDSARLREDAGALAKRAEPSESPERMLERVAALRREGRQKEADDLYAEFRKRFPDYRIPEALRDQVLPR
jgi:hypothetical protein